MPNSPVFQPAGYTPSVAVSFSDPSGNASAVSSAQPLPVSIPAGVSTVPPGAKASSSTPLTGTQSTNGTLGPFTPQTGREVWLTLSGAWTGSVQVLRSTDNGVTQLPLTIGGYAWATFLGNCNEQVSVETCAGASYYLVITLTAGSVTYRLAQ